MGLILTEKADQKNQDGSSRTLCGSWSVGAKDDHTGRGPGGKKNPAGKRSLPGHGQKRASLTVSPASGGGDTLSAQGLTFFAATILTRFLVAFFQLQAFEQAVILNLLFENAHSLFEIVVEDFDFYGFQTGSTPLFPIPWTNGSGPSARMVISKNLGIRPCNR